MDALLFIQVKLSTIWAYNINLGRINGVAQNLAKRERTRECRQPRGQVNDAKVD